MNPIFLLALLLMLIITGAYFLFAFIIIFHIKKYGMDKRINLLTLLVFCAGLLTISFLAVMQFAVLDWDRLSGRGAEEDVWKISALNSFHTDYDRR